MKNIKDHPNFQEAYPNRLLQDLVGTILEQLPKEATIFQCDCCGEWSAKVTGHDNLLLPVVASSKESCILELNEYGYLVTNS